MKTVLSGIQPTGEIHLGNYFGAVQNWVNLQEDYRCYYGVMDYHAITMPYKADKLRANVWGLILNLVAAGVEPENLFIQSLIPEHAELCWILNCFASYGQLTRMTQFKDKSVKSSEVSKDNFISAGIFDYPVLQAADILIYKADFVPVGKDQEQHLEFTRNIASRFNNQFKKKYFATPEALYTSSPKIYSTADPSKKMSKSSGPKHYINLFAEEAVVRKQIKSAVTDTGDTPVGEVSAGVSNLIQLIQACGRVEVASTLLEQAKNKTLRYSDLKGEATEALVELTSKMREARAEVEQSKKVIKNRIRSSSDQIRERAKTTLAEVKEIAGLLNPKL